MPEDYTPGELTRAVERLDREKLDASGYAEWRRGVDEWRRAHEERHTYLVRLMFGGLATSLIGLIVKVLADLLGGGG